MASKTIYKPVQLSDEANRPEDEPEQFQDEPGTSETTRSRIEPLELSSSHDGVVDHEYRFPSPKGRDLIWVNVTLLTTILLVVPSLMTGIIVAYKLSGRIWTCSLFSLHLTLSLMKVYCHFLDALPSESIELQSQIELTTMTDTAASYRANEDDRPENQNTIDENLSPEGVASGTSDETDVSPLRSPKKSCNFLFLTSVPSALDILLFGGLYRLITLGFNDVIFYDSDGELLIDWIRYYKACNFVLHAGYVIVISRLIVGTRMALVRFSKATHYVAACYNICDAMLPMLGCCARGCSKSWIGGCFVIRPPVHGCWLRVLKLSLASSSLFLTWCIYSLIVHFGPFEPWFPHNDPSVCDPLDKTECCLPFPSYFHVKPDPTTETGWRVNLKPETFPKLKGRIPIPVDFLNSLDGFSTMGPMLFYIQGMKESHEVYIKELEKDSNLRTQPGYTRLRGHEQLEMSTTPFSTTLLIDVEQKELVHHSAEIDYLDPTRPVVMVFPAQPLKHNAQYAIAVINATDVDGVRLPPTEGLLNLLDGDIKSDRKKLFISVLLPALEEATSKAHVALNGVDWGGPSGAFVRSNDPRALQLLFDFRTAGKKSQLGNARAVRDHTLKYIEDHWQNAWKDHVRVVHQEDGDCLDEGYPLARTIHGELDVPWFLSGFGPGYRAAILDPEAVRSGVPKTIGKAKFVVKIPCSLRAAVAPIPNSLSTPKDLRVMVEFGHGLFYNRAEVGDDFLIKMAERSGYILTAMDWRGMSQFDFPIVARTMLSDPSLFESIRDNLIQGYANKYALQHFMQHGMLDMNWLKFKDVDGSSQSIPHSFEVNDETGIGAIRSSFYGISQGGILGAGYLGLSGSTGLIARGVLGVPGTPFSLILSRSLEFVGYDVALLLNFYNNRHVRIFLSLAQMCWDSVEAAGVLGAPLEEPLPTILMQAGLGDPIVPTLAAERLARAIHAQVLPDNPRQIWIPPNYARNAQNSALTEMLYEREYASLPKDDQLTAKHNSVHICVRFEPVLQAQIEQFLNYGNITDPCSLKNGTACIKPMADCFNHHKIKNTSNV